MISLNKARKAVAHAMQHETSAPPEIFIFIDRGAYAIIGARITTQDGTLLHSLVGTYWPKVDRFFVAKANMSGYQALNYVGERISDITGSRAGDFTMPEN